MVWWYGVVNVLKNSFISATAREKAKKEKEGSAAKAAIGFVYTDSTGPVARKEEKKEEKLEKEDDEEEEEEDEDEDFDLTVDVMNLAADQQDEINKIGKEFDLGPRHFFR